ncbi:hypothetical protein AAHE18_18G131700 [Arachis hypogaea]
MPIIKNEHLLLSALLIAKSLALEGVSLFMEKMFSEWLAVIISATLLGIIAEVTIVKQMYHLRKQQMIVKQVLNGYLRMMTIKVTRLLPSLF